MPESSFRLDAESPSGTGVAREDARATQSLQEITRLDQLEPRGVLNEMAEPKGVA
jgi:hypothetical protein